jgi:2-methylcitrate dehydratase PrpD
MKMSDLRTTAMAVDFVDRVAFPSFPEEAVRIARRCIVDAFGLFVAGSDEKSVKILREHVRHQAGSEEAILPGGGGVRVPAQRAALVLGTAGHAHDWDDTQVSRDPRHVYGLLTHPTVPPLAATICVSERLGGVDGETFLTAFLAGFEVECKISEWMTDRHYRRGHHSSGTVGTFGSCVAAAKLLKLGKPQIANAIGIAASLSAGIRVNFGTMTKPLHVGRAAENGIEAALLALAGFSADPNALDGPWGFFEVMGEGLDESKTQQGFGEEYTIVSPGVSIKPYPSGILTHQSMDAMLALVRRVDLRPEDVKAVRFYAGKNIIEPIRYPIAQNHLQAKFSMPALLSMIILRRRASHHEFTDEFVGSPQMQLLQAATTVQIDEKIDEAGYDKIRSRIEVETTDGKIHTQWANENYRGGPDFPISDDDLERKFRMCVEGSFDPKKTEKVLGMLWDIRAMKNSRDLAANLA